MDASATPLGNPCILFALRRESSRFRRLFRRGQRLVEAPCPAAWFGPPGETILVLETGLGPAAMTRAMKWLLHGTLIGNVTYRPSLVLSAGYSGGLTPKMRVGDLVLASEVVEEHGANWQTTWPGGKRTALGPYPVHYGRLLTTDSLVADPQKKRMLGDHHQALAVDMETAVIARHCSDNRIPFGCLRAISDDWSTPLSPGLADLLQQGRVASFQVVRALIRQPSMIRECWRLARHTRQASDQLGWALEAALLAGLLPNQQISNS
jgi:nucleoside phosphorylase